MTADGVPRVPNNAGTAAAATVVVLAAGQGKRMHSAVPKSLHAICGRPLLGHVLAATAPLQAQQTVVVVGQGRDQVVATLDDVAPDATVVVQPEQRGTGDAVRRALDADLALTDTVVVLYGDMPLLRTETLAGLLLAHRDTGAAATLLSAELAHPTGYGRLLRGPDGITGIVEQRDATEDQEALREVNVGVYVFEAVPLRDALGKLTADNAQGEEYLTDVVMLLAGAGHRVLDVPVADPAEALGVNDRSQLATAAAVLRERTLRRAMLAGATVVDPATTWVDVDVVLEPDCVIEPFTMLHSRTHLEPGAVVGPYSRLTDTVVRRDASVVASVCTGADIGPEATVGPYSHLRAGTRLGRGAKAGGFVEMKNADIGAGSKVPHLSYVGDTVIGERANVGAGTITCNYDGVRKNPTTIGDDVFIGSNNTLVPPVTIGAGAYTAAGSTITDDVPPDAMAFGRARQVTREGAAAERRTPDPAVSTNSTDQAADDEGGLP